MNKAPHKSSRDRMIHVRLDEETHRRLKMYAAESSTTIQQLVESLIRRKYANSHSKEEKP